MSNKAKPLNSKMSFDEFKLNSDGMLTVVVQDYKTNEVLMVAYMTKEAYDKTIETGIMTYYSRSRNELWIKGETSGHYQYVKDLYIDCDRDTLLAKVKQIGAACHTGNYSCFMLRGRNLFRNWSCKGKEERSIRSYMIRRKSFSCMSLYSHAAKKP